MTRFSASDFMFPFAVMDSIDAAVAGLAIGGWVGQAIAVRAEAKWQRRDGPWIVMRWGGAGMLVGLVLERLTG